ncbi:DUF3099 domain-containing protein [Nocardia callitridis]|uniref:DUF3099 domain-containing protein n=1 Tax=Nocardia callitridis TaxID=648753 RepID=A0ABP9KBL4_9NOCA
MQQHGDSPDADDIGRGDRQEPGTQPTPDPAKSVGDSKGYFPGSDDHDPVLITEAAPSLEDQHRARVRRYTFIMAFRVPCLILAAVAYSAFDSALLAILILGASVPLPWIAVLIANDRPPRRKEEPSRWDRPRTALESGQHKSIDG